MSEPTLRDDDPGLLVPKLGEQVLFVDRVGQTYPAIVVRVHLPPAPQRGLLNLNVFSDTGCYAQPSVPFSRSGERFTWHHRGT